jgi:hypothetical protein
VLQHKAVCVPGARAEALRCEQPRPLDYRAIDCPAGVGGLRAQDGGYQCHEFLNRCIKKPSTPWVTTSRGPPALNAIASTRLMPKCRQVPALLPDRRRPRSRASRPSPGHRGSAPPAGVDMEGYQQALGGLHQRRDPARATVPASTSGMTLRGGLVRGLL